jgi:hypothetical protein
MHVDEFRLHITQTFNISSQDFDRLMEEFLGYFDSTLEEYVRQRHLELQREGKKNEGIYREILEEVSLRRFASRPLSLRRVRRMIYG